MRKSIKIKYFQLLRIGLMLLFIINPVQLFALSLDFSSLITSARSQALGQSIIADPTSTEAIYLNPAGLFGKKDKTYFSSSYCQDFDGQNYSGSISLSGLIFKDLAYGVSIPFQTTENLPLTIENSEGKPVQIGYFSDSKYSLMFSLAKKFTEEISTGGTIKWFNHKIYDNSSQNISLDLAFLYKPQQKFLNGTMAFGINAKNIFSTEKKWSGGRAEKLEKIFQFGLN